MIYEEYIKYHNLSDSKENKIAYIEHMILNFNDWPKWMIIQERIDYYNKITQPKLLDYTQVETIWKDLLNVK